jgi:GTP-binding protein
MSASRRCSTGWSGASSLVDDLPGVTRDRREGWGRIADIACNLIDTAGLEEAPPDSLVSRMRAQTERSLDEADVALLVIDAREGVTPADQHFAQWLRRIGKPVILVANKAESRAVLGEVGEAYALGLGDPVAISARHGEGLGELYERLLPFAGEPDEEPNSPEDKSEKPLQLAIVGRPNVGKSTLVNRLVGEERLLTGPEPGITRDAIAVDGRGGGPSGSSTLPGCAAGRASKPGSSGCRSPTRGARCALPKPSSWSATRCSRWNGRI